MNHSMFPYCCAFMPAREVKKIKEKIIEAEKSTGQPILSSLVRSVRRTNKLLRCCPICIEEETLKYGESFWHRSHQLPCVYLCPIHQCPLLQVRVMGDAQSKSPFASASPRIRNTVRVTAPISNWLLPELARHSIEVLSPKWKHHDTWFHVYRQQAVQKGYYLVNDAIAGSQLSADLQDFFGEAILKHLYCPLGKVLTTAWPALMLRRASILELPFAPVKHILLSTFLANCEPRASKPEYCRPGRVPNDYQKLDAMCVKHVQKCWDTAKRHGTRLKIQDMLDGIGMFSTFRHNRNRLPKTVILLEQFKKSNQAERQTGYRPIWRKRLGFDK